MHRSERANLSGKSEYVVRLQLGSTSTHKLEALKEACVKVGIKAEINVFPSESGVNAQPYGLDETYQGAATRARNAQSADPQAIAVGIENGIVPVGDTCVDLAVIVALTPDGQSFVGTSVGVEFLKEAVQEARKRGFKTTTASDVMAETMGSSVTDPHSTLTGGRTSRKAILVEVVSVVLSRMLSAR